MEMKSSLSASSEGELSRVPPWRVRGASLSEVPIWTTLQWATKGEPAHQLGIVDLGRVGKAENDV